jgi:hypothetical protein
MSDGEKYDRKELERLWELDYKSLATDPGETGSLKEARFVMQAKIALETKSMIKSTFWLAVATVVGVNPSSETVCLLTVRR